MVTTRSTGEQPGDRRRRRRGPARRYALAVVLAVALHGLFVGLIVLTRVAQQHFPSLVSPPRPPQPRASQPIGMRRLSVDDWERNRGVRPPKSDVEPDVESQREQDIEVVVKPKPPPKKGQRLPGANVSGVKANDEDPADSRWVAERNNRVDKETTAREKANRWQNAAQQRTAQQAREGVEGGKATRDSTAGNRGTGNEDQRRGSQQMPGSVELPDARKRDQVALKTPSDAADGLGPTVSNRRASEELKGNSDRLRVVPGPESGLDVPGGAGRRGNPGLAQLMPSRAAMDAIAGVAPSDHDDASLEQGDVTALNTREFIGSSFYSRIQRTFSQTYDGMREIDRRDPTGQMFEGRVRTTVVAVELDREGKVREVRVARGSGLNFLDLEAVRTFEKAERFPNPPDAIVEEDGTIRFTFAVIIDFGGGPRFRMFRSAN